MHLLTSSSFKENDIVAFASIHVLLCHIKDTEKNMFLLYLKLTEHI